jgi:hypothetical protein
MSQPSTRITAPLPQSETVTGFLKRELSNNAILYFAPLTAIARTVVGILAASGTTLPKSTSGFEDVNRAVTDQFTIKPPSGGADNTR